jgi:hypothetical protein
MQVFYAELFPNATIGLCSSNFPATRNRTGREEMDDTDRLIPELS